MSIMSAHFIGRETALHNLLVLDYRGGSFVGRTSNGRTRRPMTPDPAIATAADYADALMTARRWKNLLVLLVLLFLLMELAIFFVARYTNVILSDSPAVTAAVSSTQEVRVSAKDFAQYGTGLAIFLGMVFTI